MFAIEIWPKFRYKIVEAYFGVKKKVWKTIKGHKTLSTPVLRRYIPDKVASSIKQSLDRGREVRLGEPLRNVGYGDLLAHHVQNFETFRYAAQFPFANIIEFGQIHSVLRACEANALFYGQLVPDLLPCLPGEEALVSRA